jgi:phosphatidate cytidylyltransferase
MKRVLTALALTPIIVYVVLWGPGWLFLAVLTTVAVICFYEYAGIASAHGFGKLGPVAYVAGLWVLLAGQQDILILTIFTIAVLALGMRAQDLSKALPYAGAMVLGVVYVFGAWKCAWLLRMESPYWLMFALGLNWIGDIAAYYVGRRLGRHKLAPRVSPNKSWEGAAASLAASMLFGYVYMHALLPQVHAWRAVALSGAANAAGQMGDLAESAIKRGAGVKDSGTILPGHGGLLDRVDSTLFALPVIYFCVRSLAASR